MKQSFEKVERHLYKRAYQVAGGDFSVKFYAIFVCWDRKRRSFPAGDNLQDARDELGRLRQLDKGRFNFDAEKQERKNAKIKAMTLGEWLDSYLALMKNTPSSGTKVAQCAHLKRLLGHLPLSEITKVRILEYKQRRLSEALIRHGEPVEGTQITGATANREVSCLITALNLAADEGLCEDAPRIKKERETPRERTLTDAERKALLDASPGWLQRVIIAANEPRSIRVSCSNSRGTV
jgi:hypothetical protein